jgi:hypothetical protein
MYSSSIIPQLSTLNVDMNFSVRFLRRLHEEKNSFSPPSSLCLVLSELVGHLVDSAPPFPITEICLGNSSSQNPDVDSSMQLIKLAVDTGNVDTCSRIFAGMRSVPRDGELKHIISRFYPEMTKRLDAYLTEELQCSSVFREFFEGAIVSLLENHPPSTFYHTAANDLKMLIVAVKRAGGVSFLRKQ